jgi:hypothetical protein
MPQRFLRPTIRQSKRWNRCPYDAQSLYIRLLTLVDDFARYEADPELLRSEAFPFGDPAGNLITIENICLQLQTLADKDMIVLYEVEGVKYLELKRWKENARAKESRFPAPCKQMLADDNKCSPPSPSPSPSSSPSTLVLSNRLDLEKMALRTGRIFNRRETTLWSEKEMKALKSVMKLNPTEEEIALIEKRYAAKDEYIRTDLLTLLNNWNGEVDRARTFSAKNTNGHTVKNLDEWPTDKRFTIDNPPKQQQFATERAFETVNGLYQTWRTKRLSEKQQPSKP